MSAVSRDSRWRTGDGRGTVCADVEAGRAERWPEKSRGGRTLEKWMGVAQWGLVGHLSYAESNAECLDGFSRGKVRLKNI